MFVCMTWHIIIGKRSEHQTETMIVNKSLWWHCLILLILPFPLPIFNYFCSLYSKVMFEYMTFKYYLFVKVQKSNLDGLLQQHFEMAAEIKNLDTDLQMLVYENYNKFISATDAIKRLEWPLYWIAFFSVFCSLVFALCKLMRIEWFLTEWKVILWAWKSTWSSS